MDILNLGFPEIFFILLLLLVLFGPEQLTRTARSVAKTIRQFFRSSFWTSVVQTNQELRRLSNRIYQETGLDNELGRLRRVDYFSIDPPVKEKEETISIFEGELEQQNPSDTIPPSEQIEEKTEKKEE